jgi:hypothetical protein
MPLPSYRPLNREQRIFRAILSVSYVVRIAVVAGVLLLLLSYGVVHP